jgi:general secretion pathway protein G
VRPALRGWSRSRRNDQGFSLIETLVVCALIGTLSAMAATTGMAALKYARITRAIGDLRTLDTDIRSYEILNHKYPATLADVRPIVPKDPWGNPYQYTDLSDKKAKARKDHKLHPISADFDLYSIGEDGQTALPLTAAASKDDVIRAREGGFYGLASDF